MNKENKREDILKLAREMFFAHLTNGKGCATDQGAWFYPLDEFDNIVDFIIIHSRQSLLDEISEECESRKKTQESERILIATALGEQYRKGFNQALSDLQSYLQALKEKI